ncbi:helix-turn-helix domain-containing protein [Acetobacter aceti]|uniref:helix-turn-helix domain-containing protein n=1 Tax=Acetobacter aceti TaxID=435 RepID=UPI000C088465|nr:helix-turn-helix domain-containing protein [Acetobacter aceti]
MTGAAGRAHHAAPLFVSIPKIATVFAIFISSTCIEAAFNKVQVESRTMQEIFDFPEVIRIGKAADFFGFSRETAYRLIRSGDISSCRIAGRRLITSRSVHDFILRQVKEQFSIDQNADWLGTFMESCSSVPVLLSISKVSSRFGISRRSAYRLAASGRIVTIKIGRSRFIVTESIHHHIQRSITFRQKTIGTASADLRS